MINVLELDGINLEYGYSKILTSIYVRCEAGKIVGLLGRNGSGKSSLLKIVFGSLIAQSRSVRINDVPQPMSFSRRINYLPQQNLIPSFFSIRKALKLFKIEEQKIVDVFPEVKDIIGLTPSQISGGMLRIIEVMMILNTTSMFALLDEPFSGVMPVHVDTLKAYIKSEVKDKGIIVTDHLYRHITELSDQLYVLANGKSYLIQNEEALISLGYLSDGVVDLK